MVHTRRCAQLSTHLLLLMSLVNVNILRWHLKSLYWERKYETRWGRLREYYIVKLDWESFRPGVFVIEWDGSKDRIKYFEKYQQAGPIQLLRLAWFYLWSTKYGN